MRSGSARGFVFGLSLATVFLMGPASAIAQVTYQTGEPPPGALPPIESPPPPRVDPAPADIAPVTRPPADLAAVPQPSRPDVNNPVKQTGEVVKDLAKGDVKALREGPLLIHGNYCGIGARPNAVPTDALDEACMHHDACTTEGKMPSCACDKRLQSEAMHIAQDPRTSPKIQALAATMAASMAILICK